MKDVDAIEKARSLLVPTSLLSDIVPAEDGPVGLGLSAPAPRYRTTWRIGDRAAQRRRSRRPVGRSLARALPQQSSVVSRSQSVRWRE